MPTRFVNITDDDVEMFIEGEENENTRKKTRQDISLIVSFIASERQTNESFEIEQLSPEELDGHLSKFLLAVRKKNGDEFEPTTLRGFLSSVERYLKKRRYRESILTGQHFATTRDTLKSKQKELKRKGKGNKPREASCLTQQEIDTLYEKGAMGLNSPQALVNSIWFNNCMHFGLRGGKEQRDLKWGDITLKTDSRGKEYLEYSTERQTKTRPGDNPANTRSVKPRMYENLDVPPERNPVYLYKFFKAKRPENTLNVDSPFYLSVNHTSTSKYSFSETKWFKPQPMGVNKLNSLMKDCAETAKVGLDKRIANHSARKTLVQTLQDKNVPPTQIIQVTGHKNLQSVNNYSTLREKQQEDISTILSSSSFHPANYAEHSSANMKQIVSLEMEAIQRSHGSLPSTSSAALFHGKYITGGTFNVHVAANSSTESHTTVSQSPKS